MTKTNEELVKEVHLFLCDHIKWEKIMERVATIREQLKRHLSTVPADDEAREQFLCCEICGCSDNRCMITDEQLGFKICLGKDGGGCGGVVQENILKESNQGLFVMDDDNIDHELFSPQYAMQSQWAHSNTLYKCLNMQVGRDLMKYNRDDTLTSDMYKDNQRKDVYALLDEVFIHTGVDMDTVNM